MDNGQMTTFTRVFLLVTVVVLLGLSGLVYLLGPSEPQQASKAPAVAAATPTPVTTVEVVQAPASDVKTYTVVEGDSLWKISVAQGHTGSSWKTLYDKNSSAIRNPDLIYPGQVLTL